jgi:thioredoxin 1
MSVAFSSSDPSILSNGTVVVDFYADWCGPCKKYAPHFEELAKIFSKMTFVKVDTEENEAIMNHFEVSSLPTTLVLVNGQEKDRYEGFNLQDIKEMLLNFVD